MIGGRLYAFLRVLVRGFFALFYPIRAKGTENMPGQGPVLLCANHESLADPVAIICALNRPVRFMAKKEVMDVPVLGRLLRALGAFSVDRGSGDLAAVRSAMSILKEGHALGIFPQGSRSWKSGGDFQNGAALIALRSGAPVVPVYIHDRAQLFHPLKLTFGAPVDLSGVGARMNSQALEQATARIQGAVYGLKE